MTDVFQQICEKVGLTVSRSGARKAVLELLEPIQRDEAYAIRNPVATAEEITAYLDSLARDP